MRDKRETRSFMKGYKESSPRDRQAAAGERKKLALEKFRKHAADPALDQRLTQRAETRAERTALRDAATFQRDQKNARDAKLTQEAAELATQAAEKKRAEQAAQEAERARAEKSAAEHQTAAQVAHEAERKAARDIRYAARKARGRR
jgi:hypothetical protein